MINPKNKLISPIPTQTNIILKEMYPQLLNPTNVEIFHLKDNNIQIPKCVIELEKWIGNPIKETFGGKPLVCIDDKPMFAELAIVICFKKSGWESRWIETYGKNNQNPIYLSEWKDDKFKNQAENPITDNAILKVLSSIASYGGNSYSGCWDVIGWKKGRIIFAESKRFKKDRIRQTQINWLTAGLKFGLNSDNFLIVQWDIK